eukprot:SAG31_NODE_853_length_11512_cov_42.663279_4_plen_592_part_00
MLLFRGCDPHRGRPNFATKPGDPETMFTVRLIVQENNAHEEGRSGTKECPDIAFRIKNSLDPVGSDADEIVKAEPAAEQVPKEQSDVCQPPEVREMVDFVRNQGSVKLIKQAVLKGWQDFAWVWYTTHSATVPTRAEAATNGNQPAAAVPETRIFLNLQCDYSWDSTSAEIHSPVRDDNDAAADGTPTHGEQDFYELLGQVVQKALAVIPYCEDVPKQENRVSSYSVGMGSNVNASHLIELEPPHDVRVSVPGLTVSTFTLVGSVMMVDRVGAVEDGTVPTFAETLRHFEESLSSASPRAANGLIDCHISVQQPKLTEKLWATLGYSGQSGVLEIRCDSGPESCKAALQQLKVLCRWIAQRAQLHHLVAFRGPVSVTANLSVHAELAFDKSSRRTAIHIDGIQARRGFRKMRSQPIIVPEQVLADKLMEAGMNSVRVESCTIEPFHLRKLSTHSKADATAVRKDNEQSSRGAASHADPNCDADASCADDDSASNLNSYHEDQASDVTGILEPQKLMDPAVGLVGFLESVMKAHVVIALQNHLPQNMKEKDRREILHGENVGIMQATKRCDGVTEFRLSLLCILTVCCSVVR